VLKNTSDTFVIAVGATKEQDTNGSGDNVVYLPLATVVPGAFLVPTTWPIRATICWKSKVSTL
jgi:hypothetical protein